MIDHPFYDQFRELSWRRKLTPAEEAELDELCELDRFVSLLKAAVMARRRAAP